MCNDHIYPSRRRRVPSAYPSLPQRVTSASQHVSLHEMNGATTNKGKLPFTSLDF